jgi:hypothetical protein
VGKLEEGKEVEEDDDDDEDDGEEHFLFLRDTPSKSDAENGIAEGRDVDVIPLSLTFSIVVEEE